MVIPIALPTLPPYWEMEENLRAIVASGQLVNGPWTERFEADSARYLGVRYAISCSSGTAGLLAALATLTASSTVAMPSYTYSATYQAALWNGLAVQLLDCGEDGCVDHRGLEDILERGRASALVAVHMHGNACHVEELREIGVRLGVPIIYDAAHAFGSRYKNHPLAGWGDLEVFSCSPTKPLSLGEGGVIATNDDWLARRVRLVCQQGQTPGSLDATCKALNGRLGEINACIGCHALRHLDRWLTRRQELAQEYRTRLANVPGISFQNTPPECVSSYKDFVIYVDAKHYGMDRDQLMIGLERQNIQTKRYFFPPIHMMSVYREKGMNLPMTEKLAVTTLALPFYAHMPLEQLELVCRSIQEMPR